jgi:hypothetical protein
MTRFPRYRRAFTRRCVAVAAAAVLAIAGLPGTAHAATRACLVNYQIIWQGPNGFAADLTLVNLGDPTAGWTLFWQMNPGEQLGAVWNATMAQFATWVVANPNTAAGANLNTGGQTEFGWTALATTPTTVPAVFWFNGVTCQIAPAPA